MPTQHMPPLRQRYPAPGTSAFTILELLVGMTLFAVVLGIALSAVGTITSVYKSTGADAESFHKARVAFANLSNALSGATLHTYYDYEYPNNNTKAQPDRLVLKSGLHFLSGPVREVFGSTASGGGVRTPAHGVLFQAPAGHVDDQKDFGHLDSLLNVMGFYLEYGKGDRYAPAFLRDTNVKHDRFRFRLIQVTQPADKSEIYKSTSDGKYDTDWVKALSLDSPVRGDKHVLAENIIALVIRPKDPGTDLPSATDIAPKYTYDSRRWERANAETSDIKRRNQLPPIIEVTMVSTDEHSAELIETLAPGNAPAFLGVSDLFRNASDAAHRRDLDRLRRKLDEHKIPYRIFSASIPLPETGWTTAAPTI